MKKEIALLLLFAAALLGACKKHESKKTTEQVVNVSINAGDTYTFNLGTITQKNTAIFEQAQHASSSAISVNSTNADALYQYTPLSSYSGADQTRIKISGEKGKDKGGKCGHHDHDNDDGHAKIITFKFTVNNPTM